LRHRQCDTRPRPNISIGSAVATHLTLEGRRLIMANDNQGSRTFLASVLGGIVLALVIAAYFMYGHKGETNVKVEHPATEQPAAVRASPPPAHAASQRASAGPRAGVAGGPPRHPARDSRAIDESVKKPPSTNP